MKQWTEEAVPKRAQQNRPDARVGRERGWSAGRAPDWPALLTVDRRHQ